MIYNPIKKGEFDAIAKEMAMKHNLVKDYIKVMPKKKENETKKILKDSKPNNEDLIISKDKVQTYTFPKSIQKSVLLLDDRVNEERFLYNPRDVYPDPYELTHYRYLLQ